MGTRGVRYLTNRPGRPGYYFQRSVPADVQDTLGLKVWKVKAGDTLPDARQAVPHLLLETDRQIEAARGHVHRETHQEALLKLRGKLPADLTPADFHYLPQDPKEIDRVLSLPPVEPRTARELLALATRLKNHSPQTVIAWEKHLSSFLSLSGQELPVTCTREHAQKFRDVLLSSVAVSTAKTRTNYLSGLWSLMVDEGWVTENIFTGLMKRVRTPVKERGDVDITPADRNASKLQKHPLLYHLVRWTGMRIAEAAGLRHEDLKDGYIDLVPHETSPLKTSYSARNIPIHPELAKQLQGVSGTGLLFPDLYNSKTKRWAAGLTWKDTLGLNPHKLRHYVTQYLREAKLNDRTIGAILGHAPTSTTGSYGSVTMEARREAINTLK
jgi:integrase